MSSSDPACPRQRSTSADGMLQPGRRPLGPCGGGGVSVGGAANIFPHGEAAWNSADSMLRKTCRSFSGEGAAGTRQNPAARRRDGTERLF